MLDFTAWVEHTALSEWIAGSPSLLAFPFILIVHTLGMGILAGLNAAVDLRVLGFARTIPLSEMERFYRFMWFGFVINAVSGVLLVIGYPTKALTNPDFYLKLALIAVGTVLMSSLRRRAVRGNGPVSGRLKTMAVASLVAWAGAIVSGRFLAYTCTWLFIGVRC